MIKNSLGSRCMRCAAVAATLLSGLAQPLTAQVESALDQAEAWLVAQQNPNGSLGPVPELLPRDSAATV